MPHHHRTHAISQQSRDLYRIGYQTVKIEIDWGSLFESEWWRSSRNQFSLAERKRTLQKS